MPFRAMRMHCPGDENIIPLYRPEDTTAALETSMPEGFDTDEKITEIQVSVAAPKSDVTPEEKRRIQREEEKRNYWMMKDLEEGVVDWLSDDEFEKPEMKLKYSSYALTDAAPSDHSFSTKASQRPSAINPRFSSAIADQVLNLLDLGTTKSLIKPIQAYTGHSSYFEL